MVKSLVELKINERRYFLSCKLERKTVLLSTHMFWLKNKKISFQLHFYLEAQPEVIKLFHAQLIRA